MKKIIILPLLILCMAGFASAQNLKIGYINSLELLSVMPEAKAADSAIVALAKELDAQYQVYVNEAKSLYAKIQDPNLTQTQYDAISEDLQIAQQRVTDYEQSSKDKVSAKRQDLYAPILKHATDIVKQVATENGYTHVFDSSTGAIVYAPDGDNIIGLVKKKLNIK